MIRLSDLKPQHGSTHRRKIVGRGEGSGHGQSSTRGRKGQNARSGGGVKLGFEGGQMPLIRRIPKRGFTSRNLDRYDVVNICRIDGKFQAGQEVGPQELEQKGIADAKRRIKILADGAITKPLKFKAHAFSKAAADAIKKAGGTVEILK